MLNGSHIFQWLKVHTTEAVWGFTQGVCRTMIDVEIMTQFWVSQSLQTLNSQLVLSLTEHKHAHIKAVILTPKIQGSISQLAKFLVTRIHTYWDQSFFDVNLYLVWPTRSTSHTSKVWDYLDTSHHIRFLDLKDKKLADIIPIPFWKTKQKKNTANNK